MIRLPFRPALLATLVALASPAAQATSDGLLDPAFHGGYFYIGMDAGGGNTDRGRALALQGDGKVLLLGDASTGSLTREMVLSRYSAAGQLDGGFGSGGRALVSSQDHEAAAVGVAPDGKIVAVGTYTYNTTVCFSLARYDAQGVPDGSFVGYGSYVVCPGLSPVPAGKLTAAALAIAPDGSFYVGGSFDDGVAGQDFYVMKFRASNGQVDSSWGSSGARRIAFDYAGSLDDRLTAMLLQPDGKLLLAGSVARGGGDYDTALVRLSSGGLPDSGFNGGSGKITAPFDLNGVAPDGAVALALTGGGKIVVLDQVRDASSGRDVMGLMQFGADGTPDSGFGGGGKLAILGFGASDTTATLTPAGLAVQGNRRLLVLARRATGSGATLDAKYGFLRLLPDGSPDTSFNPGNPFAAGMILHDLHSADAHADQRPAALLAAGAGLYFTGAVQYSSTDANDYDMVLGRLANDLLFANDFD